MRVAAVDIGTNTILLLVADVSPDGVLRTVHDEQQVPRLGRGVDAHRNLAPDAMDRALNVLRSYSSVVASSACDLVAVGATSAVRDAANREEFLDRVRELTGWHVDLLSGEDEALWTFRGGMSGVAEDGPVTVLDVGGGSTEITVGRGTAIDNRVSLDIGAVRLTERFIRSDPPGTEEMDAAAATIRRELAHADAFPFQGSRLVGVAGTPASLAVLDQGLTQFSVEAVARYRLQRSRVEALLDRLSAMSVPAIRRLSTVMDGRADVMVAGTLIVREVMRRYSFEEMIVSERGLRYGLALRAAARTSPSR
jgi:exopolyphosphatase/guanosine-5'-triphosphate,3'-diphosphate pyrophosphatase